MVNEELVLFMVQWRLYVVIIIEEIIYFTTFDVKAILNRARQNLRLAHDVQQQ